MTHDPAFVEFTLGGSLAGYDATDGAGIDRGTATDHRQSRSARKRLPSGKPGKPRLKSWQDQPGPVKRKAIVSDEPPGLVLMRDRFPVILVVAILMGSFFFGFLMVLIRGSLRASSAAKEVSHPIS